jgi:hypothetical protein
VSTFVNWGLPILAVAVGIALLIWDDFWNGTEPGEPAPCHHQVVVEIAPTSGGAPDRQAGAKGQHEHRRSPRRRPDEDWQQLMAAHPELRSLDHYRGDDSEPT